MMQVKRKSGSIALATILLLTLGFRHHISELASRPAADVQIEQLPMKLGDWQGRESVGLDVRSQEILKLDRYVKRSYTNSKGEQVLLYVGYWKRQTGEYQAAKHSPALCLPSNGWHTQPGGTVTLTAGSLQSGSLQSGSLQSGPAPTSPGGTPITAKKIIGELKGQSHLFYYWFFTGDSNYADEWQALLRISLENFFVGRSDGGIIEISTPIGFTAGNKAAAEDAERVIEEFAAEFTPALLELISRR